MKRAKVNSAEGKQSLPDSAVLKPAPLPVPPPSRPTLMPDERLGEPFFARIDWWAFWTAFAIALTVYGLTLVPTLSLEDSGELATAGEYLGVPHPPGYPSWTLMVWIFAKIFAFVQFRGQPNPAWGIAFASAFAGALSAAVASMLVCRSGRDILRDLKHKSALLGISSENSICFAGGVASSLLFAFAPCMWSQSVIVEVYALNALFLALILLLTYMWIRRPSDNLLILTGLVFGIGLTNYQGLLLFLPALLVVVLVKDIALTRDLFVCVILFGAGIIALNVIFLLLKPSFPALPLESVFPNIIDPRTGTVPTLTGWQLDTVLPNFQNLTFYGFCTISVWFLVVTAIVYRFLPRGKAVALTALSLAAGLAVYGFMPLSSEHNPPMNWGYPRTWDGFKHALSRGQYEKIVISDIFSMHFIDQVGWYLKDLRMQFTMAIALLALIPFTGWSIRVGNRRFRALLVATILSFVAAMFLFVEELIPHLGLQSPTLEAILPLKYLLAGGILLLVVVGAVVMCLNQLKDMLARVVRPVKKRYFVAIGLLAAVVVLVALYMTVGGLVAEKVFPEKNLLGPFLFCMLLLVGLACLVFLVLEKTATPLSERITVGLILIGIAAVLGYYGGGLLPHLFNPKLALAVPNKIGLLLALTGPPIVAVVILWMMQDDVFSLELEIDPNSQKWILASVAGFFLMSLIFVALADLKGDLQDAFIQRVKFISSHALYGLWIGYGIILGLAFVDTLFRGNRLVKSAGLFFACIALPAVPIFENYCNKELERSVGGAEQNGHDFGWQFGNYQLRGAEAITEELSPDEEPLPNPVYPPEMGPRAVFFGGTDPGRFVPTYMIFSARVRSDVYLITQNALADNTYMSVMRDLYGDEIWIPSTRDGNMAFSRYIEDVRAGKIPASADIKIENGRVSVQGVGGVMLINGILAQMIFEYNRATHTFYVEESYVINWMYPYLTPHGLIMQINRDPLNQLPADVIRDDIDFWNWYTQRLTGNRKFIRDVVARKSFSKLRSAIAGVYVVRGLFPQAEIAFKEALELYPLSPEANFRLADLYLRWNRPEDAYRLMASFYQQDPGNTRSGDFAKDIKGRMDMTARINALEQDINAQIQRNPINPLQVTSNAMELCELFHRLARQEEFANMVRLIVGAGEPPTNDPARALMRDLISRSGMHPNEYLRLAQWTMEERRFDLMEPTLKHYLALIPADWRAWMDLATVRMILKNQDETVQALQQALRVGGEEAKQALRDDRRFDPIRRTEAFQRLFTRGLPLPHAGG